MPLDYAKCCKDCVLNHNCSFQNNDDVETCDAYDYDNDRK